MATKSFLKTIDVRDNILGATLADALLRSESATSKQVELKSVPTEWHGEEDVRKFFGEPAEND